MVDEEKPAARKGAKKALKETGSKERQEVEEGELPHLHLQSDEADSPGTGICSKAMSIMNSVVNDIFECIAGEASHLAHHNKRSTVRPLEIQIACTCSCPGKLAKHTVSERAKAVTKYTSSTELENTYPNR